MHTSTGTYWRVRDRIRELPVIDAHDHIADHRHCNTGRSVGSFVMGGWMRMATGTDFSGADDSALWRRFLTVWPTVRTTGPGMVLGNIFRLWDIGPDIDDTSYDPIAARLQAASPQTIRRLWAEYGIQGAITHYLGHPYCGGIENLGLYLTGNLSFEPNVFPLLGILPLHEFHSPCEIRELEALADQEISSISDLEEVIEVLISRAQQQGVVGLKDHSAYSRGLAFDVPSRHRAEQELLRLQRGADGANAEEVLPDFRGLSDYLFHHIVRLAIDLHLPIAVHTGILADGRTPPEAHLDAFVGVLRAFPEAVFDVYHLNYPRTDDLLRIMREFPNVVANCTWAHVLDPAATEEFLYRALGSLPANRIIGFGADYLESSERQIGSAELAKDLVSAALTRYVERSWLSETAATDIARLLLFDNPRNLYSLPV